MTTQDEALAAVRARLGALAQERIDWPDGAGIAINEHNEPTVGDGPHAPWIAGIGFLLWDAQPGDGEEIALIRGRYPRLTCAQARQGLAYLEAHHALFAGRAGREWLDEGEFGHEPEMADEFLCDIRALLAALDAAEARERALVAELTVARPIVRAARRLPELGVASPAVGRIIALAVLACGLRDALFEREEVTR